MVSVIMESGVDGSGDVERSKDDVGKSTGKW